ncbi:MAG TPA: ectoine/hydroxyectoine ABC transporter permease subunit EhuC [Acidimicrobiia bacterium]|nr:ectoine/hydroxyectoine ABC transporter permease subunit EhuC [Acidimicrobiia bacterium]
MEGLERYIPFLFGGLWVTLGVSIAGLAVAFVTAFTFGLIRSYAPTPARWAATGFVEFFRGTSALVQLFWAFYVLPFFGLTLAPYLVGILVLGLNQGSYGSEIVRGSIAAVPKGQLDAARALRMPPMARLRRVVLPQALPIMIPPFGNMAISMLKFTSLLSAVTVQDLTSRAQTTRTDIGESALIFGSILLVYFALSLIISSITRLIERRTSIEGKYRSRSTKSVTAAGTRTSTEAVPS